MTRLELSGNCQPVVDFINIENVSKFSETPPAQYHWKDINFLKMMFIFHFSFFIRLSLSYAFFKSSFLLHKYSHSPYEIFKRAILLIFKNCLEFKWLFELEKFRENFKYHDLLYLLWKFDEETHILCLPGSWVVW